MVVATLAVLLYVTAAGTVVVPAVNVIVFDVTVDASIGYENDAVTLAVTATPVASAARDAPVTVGAVVSALPPPPRWDQRE